MIICKLNKEHICSLCFNPIQEEEAFRFYNKGTIRFRHLMCQFKLRIDRRKLDFSEWIEERRNQCNLTRINKILKEGLEKKNDDLIRKYAKLKKEETARHGKAVYIRTFIE